MISTTESESNNHNQESQDSWFVLLTYIQKNVEFLAKTLNICFNVYNRDASNSNKGESLCKSDVRKNYWMN